MNNAKNPATKSAAPALLRWALGLLMLSSGLSKVGNLGGFVDGYLRPAFAQTPLPAWMVAGYGYALPPVEALLGLLLLLGLCRRSALLLNGLTLISLAFGQMLLKNHPTVGTIFAYVLMTALALWMAGEDGWSLDARLARRRSKAGNR